MINYSLIIVAMDRFYIHDNFIGERKEKALHGGFSSYQWGPVA